MRESETEIPTYRQDRNGRGLKTNEWRRGGRQRGWSTNHLTWHLIEALRASEAPGRHLGSVRGSTFAGVSTFGAKLFTPLLHIALNRK